MKDQDWDIKERSACCLECEKQFVDKEIICSKLTFGEEGYTRVDLCEPCWDKKEQVDALSVWRGTFKAPPPPAEEALKKETAESLLRQLIEQEDPANGNTIYILAVMLERRRVFAEKDVQVRDDGVKIRVYEHKKTGEVFLIPDPELKLAEIEHVQEEVVVMLGGKPRGQKSEASGQQSEDSDAEDGEDEFENENENEKDDED